MVVGQIRQPGAGCQLCHRRLVALVDEHIHDGADGSSGLADIAAGTVPKAVGRGHIAVEVNNPLGGGRQLPAIFRHALPSHRQVLPVDAPHPGVELVLIARPGGAGGHIGAVVPALAAAVAVAVCQRHPGLLGADVAVHILLIAQVNLARRQPARVARFVPRMGHSGVVEPVKIELVIPALALRFGGVGRNGDGDNPSVESRAQRHRQRQSQGNGRQRQLPDCHFHRVILLFCFGRMGDASRRPPVVGRSPSRVSDGDGDCCASAPAGHNPGVNGGKPVSAVRVNAPPP